MFDPFNPSLDVPAPPPLGGSESTVNVPPAPNPQAGYADSIAQWYRQYLGREASAGEIQGWLQGGTPISQIEAAIRESDEAKQFAGPTPPPGPGGTGGPAGPGVGGGAAPPANVGGLIAPFAGKFGAPTPTPYPEAPSFTPPSMEQAANDPGYIFSLNQGKKNLESWLAAHGTFNDSSAAEALQDYGQGAAATQYGNVWNRAYQGWQGALGPWQSNVGRIQHDNDMNWQNAFNTWLQQWNVFKDQRDSTFNKQFQVATA